MANIGKTPWQIWTCIFHGKFDHTFAMANLKYAFFAMANLKYSFFVMANLNTHFAMENLKYAVFAMVNLNMHFLPWQIWSFFVLFSHTWQFNNHIKYDKFGKYHGKFEHAFAMAIFSFLFQHGKIASYFWTMAIYFHGARENVVYGAWQFLLFATWPKITFV